MTPAPMTTHSTLSIRLQFRIAGPFGPCASFKSALVRVAPEIYRASVEQGLPKARPISQALIMSRHLP
jgi:hypothetical protein